jgi:hypothetical protein
MPSQLAIQEFKELFFRSYGVLLSDAEALEQSGRLLRLYKTIYGPFGTHGTDDDHEKTLPA